MSDLFCITSVLLRVEQQLLLLGQMHIFCLFPPPLEEMLYSTVYMTDRKKDEGNSLKQMSTSFWFFFLITHVILLFQYCFSLQLPTTSVCISAAWVGFLHRKSERLAELECNTNKKSPSLPSGDQLCESQPMCTPAFSASSSGSARERSWAASHFT